MIEIDVGMPLSYPAEGRKESQGGFFFHTAAAGHDLYTATLLLGLDLPNDQGTHATIFAWDLGFRSKQVKVKK